MAIGYEGFILMRSSMRIAVLSFIMGLMTLAAYARGYPVPDEVTAIRVAEKVLIPIYGRKHIESERPFTAVVNENVWTVYGHLPPGWDGGVAEVKIDKRNGKILRITHGK
jgi:hypothetical protein